MDAGDLYGLPRERFTAARNELAKQLRKEGRREEADRASKLRKPSVAAWAVNQLVRTQPRQFSALLKAGDALRQAQENVLAGEGDAGSLRAAVHAERTAVDGLVEKARGLLSAEGHALTAATLDRVTDTLHATALDAEARAQVEDGCLEHELRHVGLGALPAPPAPPRARHEAKPPRKRREPPRARPKAKPAAQAERLKAARRAETQARREAERATREVETALERRARAKAELRAREDALADARKRAEKAARELERATREVRRVGFEPTRP